jgi:hypothetical protein
MIKTILFTLLLISVFNASFSQNMKATESRMKEGIYFLASDSLEGRLTSSKGELIAATYIANCFQKIGLAPKGDHGGYSQAFKYNDGKSFGSKNALSIGGKNYALKSAYYPINYSANGHAAGTLEYVGRGLSIAGFENDYANKKNLNGKIFLMECGYPSGMDPHSEKALLADITTRIDSAISRGAKAVIFINSDTSADDLKMNFDMKVKESSIPILFLKDINQPKRLSGNEAIIDVETFKLEKESHNVVGYIDNGAAFTVVLGAHYDHLGYGEKGNSLYRGAPAIHNGADDNASGVVSLIALATVLKEKGPSSNNYLFIAFSGEELGLYGSKSFTENEVNKVDSAHINYMINMDMVGRLSSEEKNLSISGTGTSPQWTDILAAVHVDSIRVKPSESGIGPSDHTSFYLKNIPVLHFFSGSHSDYHKPSDDAEKINFSGMLAIDEYIYKVIEAANAKGKLSFTKTKEDKNENTPRFKVTLGVIPDYMFDGEGMRIDGVSDGKPAAASGLLKGDIVVQLGEHKVTDMMSYMKALSMFKKGETTALTFMRNNKKEVVNLTF